MNDNQNGFQKAQALIQLARENARTDLSDAALDKIILASTYGEPGYGNPKSGAIALGDWNPVAKNDPTLPMLAAFLMREGIDALWANEWIRCEECGRLYRSEPDQREWTRSYQDTDNGTLCLECIKAGKETNAVEN